jgi:predicted nucleic acid-binding protein
VSIYVDSSALLKHYLSEPDRSQYEEILNRDPDWVMARHTDVEVRRNLARHLMTEDFVRIRKDFEADWWLSSIVELDEGVCDRACEIAESTGARTLDALHLAAADLFGGGDLAFVTADGRQGRIARSLGWIVLGA